MASYGHLTGDELAALYRATMQAWSGDNLRPEYRDTVTRWLREMETEMVSRGHN